MNKWLRYLFFKKPAVVTYKDNALQDYYMVRFFSRIDGYRWLGSTWGEYRWHTVKRHGERFITKDEALKAYSIYQKQQYEEVDYILESDLTKGGG